MTGNTKARSQEIYTAAVAAIEAAGGVAKIDQLPQEERLATLHRLYNDVSQAANCHRDTAKRNVAKALRKGRYAELASRWGGPREGSGYPKGQKRTKQEKPMHSTRVTVTNQELADTIKNLPHLQTWEREQVEDRIGPLGPSGLLAYADDPVAEAIGVFEEIKTGWELARKYPQSYHRTEAEIDAGIADALDMIAKLKS